MAEHGSFGSVCWNCSEQMTELYFNKALWIPEQRSWGEYKVWQDNWARLLSCS